MTAQMTVADRDLRDEQQKVTSIKAVHGIYKLLNQEVPKCE